MSRIFPKFLTFFNVFENIFYIITYFFKKRVNKKRNNSRFFTFRRVQCSIALAVVNVKKYHRKMK